MIAAVLALLVAHVAFAVGVVRSSRAPRRETGTFAGLAAEIDRLARDGTPGGMTCVDEFEPMRLAA